MSDGWMTGDPPCYVTNDHHWHGGSICTECGDRLRCVCGQFVREDHLDEHFAICSALKGDCSEDCLERCAYPGQFAECGVA